jgi:nucleotide-binding universal stress UspA family protein
MIPSDKKVKRILVAVDFSIYSKETLEYAYELSRITRAELVGMNVINQRDIDTMRDALNARHPNTFMLVKYLPDEMERRRSKFKVLIEGCEFTEKPDIKFIVDHGVPFTEILRAIEDEKADLLVIGSKGRTNIRSTVFGSVAEKLFRHSPVTVMSLRSHGDTKGQ